MGNSNFNWDAVSFFEGLTAKNKLAQSKGYRFCRVSGLRGLEEYINNMQSVTCAVCASDIAAGTTQLDNTPHTRRVKTVYMLHRHRLGDMQARQRCMDEMRELFRQFMTKLILERTRISQGPIYIDPRIQFTEIDEYFAAGCALAYFQIAVDVYTDLRINNDEWLS